jgi:hypothetical protein
MQTSLPGRDYTTDANPVALEWAISQIPLPGWVEECTPEDKAAGYSGIAFADSKNKCLPVSNKADTLLSGIYAFGLPDSDYKTKVLKEIEKAATVWGIEETLSEYAMLFEEEKKASCESRPVEKCAMSVKMENGVVEHFYPLNNPLEICDSANAIVHDLQAGKIPVEWASDACVELRKQAKALSLSKEEIPPFAWEQGEERDLFLEGARVMLGTRKNAAAESFPLYEEIINTVEKNHESAKEAEHLIGDVDRVLGIDYTKGHPTPRRVLFCGPSEEEFAKLAGSTITLDGILIPVQEVAAAKESDIRTYWAKDDAERVVDLTKAAGAATNRAAQEIAEQLPEELQKEIVQFLIRGS